MHDIGTTLTTLACQLSSIVDFRLLFETFSLLMCEVIDSITFFLHAYIYVLVMVDLVIVKQQIVAKFDRYLHKGYINVNSYKL